MTTVAELRQRQGVHVRVELHPPPLQAARFGDQREEVDVPQSILVDPMRIVRCSTGREGSTPTGPMMATKADGVTAEEGTRLLEDAGGRPVWGGARGVQDAEGGRSHVSHIVIPGVGFVKGDDAHHRGHEGGILH